MIHIKLMQRKDGRYEFAQIGSDGVRPVGYCAPWMNWPKDWQERMRLKYDQYVAERDRYHTDGHETPEEAAACYKRYVLDHELDLTRVNSDAQYKCVVCGEWTQGYARVGWTRQYALCDQHRTREQVELLYEITPDTEFWIS
jgi:hypothetical protein